MADTLRPVRRLFLAPREIPSLVLGALRGDPVALRRILGARRAGRTGLALAVIALALAAPSPAAALLVVVLHLFLALYVVIPRPGSLPLSVFQELLLSLWTAAPAMALLASLRLVWPESWLPAFAAVLLGHLLVMRGLRSGLA